MWWVWVALGACVWLATIAASGAVNYLAGFQFGRSAAEAHVFAVLGVCADAWKALGPIFIVTLPRERRFLPAALAFAVWIVCLTFAVSAALGLVAQNRSALTGGRELVHYSLESASEDLALLQRKRAALGDVGAPGEYRAAIDAALAVALHGGTVATISVSCSKDNLRTRVACAHIAELRSTLARGIEAEKLESRIAEAKQAVADWRRAVAAWKATRRANSSRSFREGAYPRSTSASCLRSSSLRWWS